jgi:hypothetical protein
MRPESEQQPEEDGPDLEPGEEPEVEEEVDGHFDVDEYAAPDSEEIDVADRGTWFEDGDLYVEEEETDVLEGAEEPVVREAPGILEEAEASEGPVEAETPGGSAGEEALDESPATEGPEAPATQPAEPTAGPAEEPAEPKEPREPIGPRVKAAWAALLTEARKIELPGAPNTKRKRIGTVAAIVLASIFVGAGTYLLGKGAGADVDQARLEGTTAGKQAGAIEGAARGYSAGFRRGQQRGFRKAYVPAYRLYYKRAFEQAGLDVPTNEEIRISLP